MNKRNILYIIGYLLVIVIGMFVIHEAGHFVAALAMGVPFNEITIGFINGNPGVTISDRFRNAPILPAIQYAGGFSAAAVLISVYFLLWFRRYRREPSRLVWILGLLTLTFAGEEIGNGIVEGHFHAAYIYYANSPFSLTNIMIIIFAAFGFLFHVLLSYLFKPRLRLVR